jgi:hypothetical protein
VSKILPTNYHIEVYENSFVNDPVWGMESSTPFPSVSVGDGFYHQTLDIAWYNPPQEGQELRVSDIKHIFWVIEGKHIGHKLMVCLKLKDIKK